VILGPAERLTEGNIVATARVLLLAIAAGSVAVGTATPASARPVDPPMYGVYTYHQDGVPDETWSLWPTCVEAGCVLHMSSVVSPHLGPDSDMPGYGGDARKVDGRWTWQLVKDKGATCPDGTKTPATYSYSWDQATLAGTVTTLTSDDCGMKPGATKHSFTLAYKEPLPIPVILDPLNQIENLW
jgi:hypothetical protein